MPGSRFSLSVVHRFADRAGLPSEKSHREIGGLAVWTVTSAKPGNGVELLRDGRTDTYWQSDGLQPHLVNLQFQRRVHTPFVNISKGQQAGQTCS